MLFLITNICCSPSDQIKTVDFNQTLLREIGCSKLMRDQPNTLPTLRCQEKRPDLFEAKHCTEYGCFCINITDGSKISNISHNSKEVSCENYEIELDLVVDAGRWFPIKKKFDLNLNESIHYEMQKILESSQALHKILSIVRRDTETANTRFIYFYTKIEILGSGEDLKHLSQLIKSFINKEQIGNVPLNGQLTKVISYVKPNPNPDESLIHQLTNEKNSELQVSPFFIRQSEDEEFLGQDTQHFESNKNLYPNEDNLDRSKPNGKKIDEQQSSSYWPISGGDILQLLNQAGVLAGVIGAAITMILLLILFIVFCIYRLRKRDEGSYALDEPKKLHISPSTGGTSYTRAVNREFYA